MKYTVDKKGFYGNFGGAFVPEMLFPNLDELEKNYNKIINDSNFQKRWMAKSSRRTDRPSWVVFRGKFFWR